jgi:quercetin dioxygenase-like cupin family protein
MRPYEIRDLKTEVEDLAPRFGYSPELESRFARAALELQHSGLSYFRIAPGFRIPFGHYHATQEEVYVVLSGSLRVKVEDDVVELTPLQAIRVAPPATRCMEAGKEGAEVLAFSAAASDNSDAVMVPGWWSDVAPS